MTTYQGGIAIGGTGGVMLGVGAGDAITTGQDNVLVGANAGAAVTSGNSNVLLGTDAGKSVTTGATNVVVGNAAAGNATTGTNNVVVGAAAAAALTTASNNVLVGAGAGAALTTGARNVFVGQNAGTTVGTGDNNVILGGYAGTSADERYALHLCTADGARRLYWPGTTNPAAVSAPVSAPVLAVGDTVATLTSGNTVPQLSLCVPTTTNLLTAVWRGVGAASQVAAEVSNMRPVMTSAATAISIDGANSNRFYYLTAASAVTVTLATTNVTDGMEFEFFNATTFVVTFTVPGGFTCKSLGSKLKLSVNGAAVLKCVVASTSTFVLIGALEA